MVEHQPADDRGSSGPWLGGAGTEPTASVVTGRAVSGGVSRSLLVVAAGVATLIIGLALVGRLGTGGGSDVSDATPPTLPGFFTTTTTVDAVTSTSAVVVADPGIVSRTTMSPGDYLLGEPTGLWLFYGGDDPLQRIDLDNGELVDFGIEAYPVLATSDDVVLYQGDSKVSGWVSSAQPGEQALNWKPGLVAPGPAEGLLWILDDSQDMEHPSGEPVGSGRWVLFDTATNRVVERRPGDRHEQSRAPAAISAVPVGRFEVLSPGPDYSSRPDGVYRYGDDEYRRVGDGRVLAYDGTSVLIEDCAAGPCSHSWIDRADGEPIGDPVPSRPVVSAELLAGGRWLHIVDRDGQSQLLDRETGGRFDFDRLASPTVSPDGRWLAWVFGQEDETMVFITDLVSDETFSYRGLSKRGAGDLLFVER